MKRLLIAIFTIAAAVPSFGQQDPARERGFRPEQVHQFNGLDSINLFNGNLNLSIPLGPSYPVAADLSYSFALHYSGNVWKTRYHCTPAEQQTGDCGMMYMRQPSDNAGPGWRLSFGELRAPIAGARPHTANSMWEYTSPDGSEHLFYPTLYDPPCTTTGQTDCDPVVAGVAYTRDGTYLRLVDAPDGAKVVEFGNGQRQLFSASGALQYIYSVSSTLVNGVPATNYVKFEYPAGTGYMLVTDSHGRTHRVYSYGGGVDKLELAAFVRTGDAADVTATYNLTYGAYTIGADGQPVDGPSIQIKEPCDARPQNNSQTINFLTRLDLPSGERYEFAYHQPLVTCDDYSAALTEMTLPTMGRIAWKYQRYGFVASPLEYASGVKERLVKNPAGTVIQKMTYEFVPQGEDGHDVVVRQCRTWTDTTCTAETKTVNHFMTGPETPFGYGPSFGLPVSPTIGDPDTDLQLSSQTFDCNPTCSATPERSTYLVYEYDYVTTPSSTLCNFQYPCVRDQARRIKSERTVYDSDGGRYSQTDYSLFDGLGHYRKAVTSGTFSSGNVRTTETNYNSHSRNGGPVGVYATNQSGRAPGYASLLPTDPWILNTYGNAYTLENGAREDAIACFDQSTGFLKRRRTMAAASPGATDLLAVFTRDSASGYAQREEYFGGDKNPIGTSDTCGMPLPGHDQYTFRIDHTYQYGALKTSTYMKANGTAMPFVSVQNTIDRNTGLVASSTDPAGVVTKYRHDRAGRLDLLDQPTGGLADTTYTYVPAGSSTPSSVTVSTGTGSAASSVKYEFDSIGRLWREHHLMPDDSWSVIETAYDSLGRQSSISEKETFTGASFTPAHKTVFSGYDAFGRAGSIVAPDGKSTTITYAGVRKTTRTTNVATGIGTVTPAVTVQEHDRAGRLWRVTENGSDVTTYGYGTNAHLTSVTMGVQSRTFSYDGRGLLVSEVHPESGATSYEYDARGHAVTRAGAVATLTTAYDRAERVLAVFHDGVGLLKEFAYDRPNSSVDYSMGKVAEAIRHNRSTALGDVTIKETYIYGTRRGLLSRKDTTISTTKSGTTTAGGQFSDAYEYTDLGGINKVTYPSCTADCTGDPAPGRTVNTTFAHGKVTNVDTYTKSITYHPNGLLHQIRHANAGAVDGPLYTQDVAASNGMARPDAISVSNFCSGSDLSITTQPQSGTTVGLNQPAGISVTAPGATEWQWYKVSGAGSLKLTGQTSATLTSTVSAESTYWVRVGNGNCSIDSNPATVHVESCPAVTLSMSDPSPIAQGGSKTIHVAIAGSSATSWTIQWSDQSQSSTTSSSSFVRVVTPGETKQYTLTILAAGGCSAVVSNAVTVTVVPPAPPDIEATAVTTSQVLVSWNYTAQADQFIIERRGPGQTSFSQVGVVNDPSHSFPDTTAVANTAYLYRVKAVKAGTASAASGFDVATTVIFNPDPITFRTEVSANLILQLRTAANALRALYSTALAPFAFTDPTLSGVGPKAIHITEIQNLLGDTRSNLGLPAVQSTGPPPQANQLFNAYDINDLRRGVQ